MKKILVLLALALCLGEANAEDANNMKPDQKIITQTAGRKALGELAPEFAHLNDDVLFGEVWNRQGELSLHDRSLVTILSLASQGITDSSLKYHLMTAKANGVTRQELAEVITHAAFYMGWPKAWSVFSLAKDVWTDKAQTLEEFQMSTPYPVGKPNDTYAKYFIGNSYIANFEGQGGAPVKVTFEPGCRDNWHVHHDSVQVLVCVAGRGWYQEWGKEAVEMTPGTVIAIPVGVKHWHGAAKDSWFQHLTYMTKAGKDAGNEWLEPVTDEVYGRLK